MLFSFGHKKKTILCIRIGVNIQNKYLTNWMWIQHEKIILLLFGWNDRTLYNEDVRSFLGSVTTGGTLWIVVAVWLSVRVISSTVGILEGSELAHFSEISRHLFIFLHSTHSDSSHCKFQTYINDNWFIYCNHRSKAQHRSLYMFDDHHA